MDRVGGRTRTKRNVRDGMTPQGHGFGLDSLNFGQVVRHGEKDQRRCGLIGGTKARELSRDLAPSAERRLDIV